MFETIRKLFFNKYGVIVCGNSEEIFIAKDAVYAYDGKIIGLNTLMGKFIYKYSIPEFYKWYALGIYIFKAKSLDDAAKIMKKFGDKTGGTYVDLNPDVEKAMA